VALSKNQIEQLWVQEGGNPKAANIAAAVALAESGGNPGAINNKNTDGSIDRGLFQINSVHGAQSTTNLRQNVRAAIRISNNGANWHPWVTFQTGAYKAHLGGSGGSSMPIGPPANQGRASSSLTIPGGTTTQTQADPAAEKRVILANYLRQVDPKSLLLRLGVVSPNESTTQQVSVPLPPQQVSVPGAGASNSTGSAKDSLVTHMKGVANFEGHKVAAWIAPALEYARQHGWKGQVTSGFRSFADQQRIYNSGVRPAAKPGTSNHEFTAYPGGAVDVSAAQQLAQILAKSPYAGKLVYAGAKDPVHFSHPHNGGY
jgi:hypothetical protein